MTAYNELSPAQIERLAIIAEEAAEVVQCVGKILRRGYDRGHPRVKTQTNRDHLEEEIGNLLNIVNMMSEAGDIDFERVHAATIEKSETIHKYLYHQRKRHAHNPAEQRIHRP